MLRNGVLVGEYETATLPRIELIARMIGKDAQAVAEMTAQHAAEPAATERRPLLRQGARPQRCPRIVGPAP